MTETPPKGGCVRAMTPTVGAGGTRTLGPQRVESDSGGYRARRQTTDNALTRNNAVQWKIATTAKLQFVGKLRASRPPRTV